MAEGQLVISRFRLAMWPASWRKGLGVGLATPKVAGSTPGLALSANNFGQVIHTHSHVHMSLSSIIWYQSRGGDAQRLGR